MSRMASVQGDCVIVADDNLTVIDFKYGLGVIVDAENNPQMIYGSAFVAEKCRACS